MLIVSAFAWPAQAVLAAHGDFDARCPDIERNAGESLDYFLVDHKTGEPINENEIQPTSRRVDIHAIATAYGECIPIYDDYWRGCVDRGPYRRAVNNIVGRDNQKTTRIDHDYFLSKIFGKDPTTGTTKFYQVLDSRDLSTSTGPLNLYMPYPGSYTVTLTNLINTTPCELTPGRVTKIFTLVVRDAANDKDLGCSSSRVGNPCDPATGNKYQREEDYAGPALPFVRHYNSGLGIDIGLGFGWTSSYHKRLERYWDGTLRARRGDGRAEPFRSTGNGWQGDADSGSALSEDGSGYTLSLSDGGHERYDVTGRLLSETERPGKTTSYTYDGTSGRLQRVTDDFGRTLSFAYGTDSRLQTLTDPAGRLTQYAYDSKDNLATVIHPDATTRRYHYESTSFGHHLTGISDENGSRFASWSYDHRGRASSSEHAGGVDKVTLRYYSNGTTKVTDALGTARTYSFQTILDAATNTAISQPCTDCGDAASRTYDANGNVASKTDFNGNKTTCYDLARNLEISRTEAQGTPEARTVTTAWHPTFSLPIRITEPGRINDFVYDANGNLLEKKLTAGTKIRTWTYTYNALGQVLTVNGPRTDVSDITTYTYDAQGNLAAITNALGHVTRITQYDTHGHPLRIEDPNGLVTTLTYDPRGRLTSRTTGIETTGFEYDGVGQLKKVMLPTGAFLSYSYDAAYRLTDIEDNLGNTIHYTLDLMGNRPKEDVLDPQGTLKQTHARVYNGLNRLIKDIGAAGQTTEYGYDNNGNLMTLTDPLNQVTTSTYDSLNRLVDVQDPLLGHTETRYDPLDQVTRIIDPLGSATDYTIDGLGDTEETDSPDTGITHRSFDAAGNVLSETDARGKTTTHQYDALNRLTQTIFDDGSQMSYTYDTGTDNRGRLIRLIDPNGSTSWSDDSHGRPTQRRQLLDGIQLTVNYDYDPQGRLIEIAYPSGKAVTFAYDLAGRVDRVQADGQTIVEELSYHPFGPVTGWRWGNGSLHTRSLDLDGRISAYPLGGTTHNVSYDPASRITGISGAESKSYGYDALDRLTSVTAPGITQTYSYDPNGNRLTEMLGAQTASYYGYTPGSNRLQSRTQSTTENYTYDPAGNLISDGTHSYTYDACGRRVQTTTGALNTSYRYNGLGERVSKMAPGSSAVNRRFFYDDAGHLIAEYDGGGMAIQETVYLGHLPIAVLSGTDDIHYVHADQINTPRVITDTQGRVVWRWESDPFGVGEPDQDPDGDGLGFVYNSRMPGQYFDVETGFHYNYFRDYDASLGVYIQSDPIGLAGGLNTYTYTGANPISQADPFGLCSCKAKSAATKKYSDDPKDTPRRYWPPGVKQVTITCAYDCEHDGKQEEVSGSHKAAWWSTQGEGLALLCLGVPTEQVYSPLKGWFVYMPLPPESFDPRSSESPELRMWGDKNCKCAN